MHHNHSNKREISGNNHNLMLTAAGRLWYTEYVGAAAKPPLRILPGGGFAVKIVTLLENTAIDEGFAAEHGLSLYIETGDRKILFDAGQTGAFWDNARKLGVDLGAVEIAVLSHGHYDHGGGLLRFLEGNGTAPVYLRREAFGHHYNARGKYIGLDRALEENPRLVFTQDSVMLGEGIWLCSCNDRPRPYPENSCGLTVLEAGQLRPDDFRHEQYLLIEEAGKRYLFSGCSHKGILNILHWFRPDVLVGGFHFKDLDPDGERLRQYGEALAAYDTMFYTGHCTGQPQFERLKPILGDRLHAISTGMTIEI